VTLKAPPRRSTALSKCHSRHSHRHTACRRRFSCMSRLLSRLRCSTSPDCRPLPGSVVPTKLLLGNPGVSRHGNTWICWWHGWSLLPAQAHSAEVHVSEQTVTGRSDNLGKTPWWSRGTNGSFSSFHGARTRSTSSPHTPWRSGLGLASR
jgi:hypothetical protein